MVLSSADILADAAVLADLILKQSTALGLDRRQQQQCDSLGQKREDEAELAPALHDMHSDCRLRFTGTKYPYKVQITARLHQRCRSQARLQVSRSQLA